MIYGQGLSHRKNCKDVKTENVYGSMIHVSDRTDFARSLEIDVDVRNHPENTDKEKTSSQRESRVLVGNHYYV